MANAAGKKFCFARRLRMKPGPSLSVKCAELTLPIGGAPDWLRY